MLAIAKYQTFINSSKLNKQFHNFKCQRKARLNCLKILKSTFLMGGFEKIIFCHVLHFTVQISTLERKNSCCVFTLVSVYVENMTPERQDKVICLRNLAEK